MSIRRLTHGPVTGKKCPYCQVIAQPMPDRDDGDGLAAHVRVVHPQQYQVWQTWPAGKQEGKEK